MGWGKILGDFAKGYIGERGIDGTMDDINSIKNGVQKLFGSNDNDEEPVEYNDDDAEAYQAEWNQTTENINNFVNSNKYNRAYNALDAFYNSHNEERDFWYCWWYSYILIFQWENAAFNDLDGIYDGNTSVSSDTASLRSKLDVWFKNMDEYASEDNEFKEIDKLKSELNENEETVSFIIECHKMWNEIGQLTDPNHIVTSSKSDDFRKAFQEVKDFYNNDSYYYFDGLLRIYTTLLRNALEDDSFLQEISTRFDKIRDNMADIMKLLKEKASDDDGNVKTAYKNCDDANELLSKVAQKLRNNSKEKTQGIGKLTAKESEYLEEIKACLTDDGGISDRERRILNRLRDSLGISEARAQELESSLSKGMTDDEKEYVEAVKDSIVDGEISGRERRLLDKLYVSLGISDERAKELEDSVLKS